MSPRDLILDLSLRPVTPEDTPFLRQLYGETRARELDATGWPEDTKAAFLQGQFDAQSRSYQKDFPDASFDVIVVRGKSVGRLYVARLPGSISVVDITLMAACRGRGWGTALLRGVIAEAEGRGVPVRLHVTTDNRAQRLYQRLGFRETGQDGFHRSMERAPEGGKDVSRRRELRRFSSSTTPRAAGASSPTGRDGSPSRP